MMRNDSSVNVNVSVEEMKMMRLEEPAPNSSKVGQKRRRNNTNTNVSVGEDESEHLLTERQRRKKMRDMFSCLHAMIPQLAPHKADKATIVDEAVKYINELEKEQQNLLLRKKKRQSASSSSSREAFLADQYAPLSVLPPVAPATSFQTWFTANVVVNICGNDAIINVCSAKKPGILNYIFFVLHSRHLEVVTGHFSSDAFRAICMFHVTANQKTYQFGGGMSLEEIYKTAAGEINLWLLA